MTRFVKREKMSRKARRELDARGRRTWTRSPAVRITESRKKYDRRRAKHDMQKMAESCFFIPPAVCRAGGDGILPG